MREPTLKQIAPWTRRIIIINVVIAVLGQLFLATLDTNPMQTYFALRISEVLKGEFWQLFTYMWLHADDLIIHVIFNMMTLYFLGRVVEFKLGSKLYLWLYVLGGLASVGLFMVDISVQGLLLGQTVYLDRPLVGASGAVCAVFGVFSILMPDSKLSILFLPYPVRAVKAVRGFALFSVVAMVLGWVPAIADSATVGWFFSIAHSAHLGGILFGWWFFGQVSRNQRYEYTPYRMVQEEEVSEGEGPEVETMNPFEIRQALDPILAKISADGIDSLTDRERRILEVGRQLFG